MTPNLMWWNLEHVAGACSEHAKAKRYTQRRAAWGDAHPAAGTHRANGTSRKCNHRALPRGVRGVSSASSIWQGRHTCFLAK
jgi:hypothetical protein